MEREKEKDDKSSLTLDTIEDDNKEAQLRYIESLIGRLTAYSLYNYKYSRYWMIIYWISNGAGICLTTLNTIVSAIYSPCSSDNNVLRLNVILGAIIMAGLSGITFLNASTRQNVYETAGDEYMKLRDGLFIDVFCAEKPPSELDLADIITKYSAKIVTFQDRFTEPDPKILEKIMKTPDYNFMMSDRAVWQNLGKKA